MEEEKLYIYHGMTTMKTLSKLRNIPISTCILASNNENWDEFSNKISHRIVTIDSEKWVIHNHSYPNFIKHYKEIIDIIERGCHN